MLFLPLLLVAVGSTATDSAADSSAECTVKAWVRADDLAPNAISHGELKVKVVQPCADIVQSVALWLRLDESAEEAQLANTTTSGDFWDWAGDAPRQEWTTTRYKRRAWQIEKIVFGTEGMHQNGVLDWASGPVFPFSVVSPNVNYPPAIFPLIFRRSISSTHTVAFSRGYRYSALVTLADTSGNTTNVEVPAGFTAFLPVTASVAPHVGPREMLVEAISKEPVWGCGEHGRPGDFQPSPEDEKRLELRVVMPEGGIAVQGREFAIALSLPNGEDRDSATSYTVSAALRSNIRPTFASESREPEIRRGNYRNAKFQELHSRLWSDPRRKKECARAAHIISEPLRVRVDDTFPRTTGSASAPFTVSAEVVINVAEVRDAAHLNPLGDYTFSGSATDSELRTEDDGWEFGPCDLAGHHSRTYTTRVPITVLGRESASPASEQVVDYLDDDFQVPCIVVAPETHCTFEIASPLTVQDTRTSPGPVAVDDRYVRNRMMPVDAKAGQYVGALWQSHLHRLHPVPIEAGGTSAQLRMEGQK